MTASVGALLFVLLAAEGFTILRVRSMLAAHIFLGVMLVPPVLLKIGTTTYRFYRYYARDPRYLRKGPPVLLLRLLGPAMILLTLAVLGSGVALIFVTPASRSMLLTLHKASFVLWFGATTIHVLGHLLETARLAPLDWYRRTRREVRGASVRQWALVAALVFGALLGVLLVGHASTYLAA